MTAARGHEAVARALCDEIGAMGVGCQVCRDGPFPCERGKRIALALQAAVQDVEQQIERAKALLRFGNGPWPDDLVNLVKHVLAKIEA